MKGYDSEACTGEMLTDSEALSKAIPTKISAERMNRDPRWFHVSLKNGGPREIGAGG